MSEGQVKVFITMSAKPETTIFEWERQLEELRAAVGWLINEKNWGWLSIYGPNSGGFGIPGVVVELSAPLRDLDALTDKLVEEQMWIDLPINVYWVTNQIVGNKGIV